MPYIQKTVKAGNTLFVYKHYSARYGKRSERSGNTGKTSALQKEINNRIKRDRKEWVLLENFKKGDLWIGFTYRREIRPDDMETAKRNMKEFLRQLSRKVKKGGERFTYMQTTERGQKGGLHHHIICKSNFDIGLLTELWKYGKVIINVVYSDNLLTLAGYFAKGSNEENEKWYSQSRNLKMPKVRTKVMSASVWRREVKVKKGFELCEIYNGYHEVLGYEFQRYIMRMVC